MPSGVYKRTEKMNTGKYIRTDETRIKMSKAQKGRKISEETKKKLSEITKKRTGEKAPMYGKHHTQMTKDKISKGNKGKIVSDETKKKISDAMQERKRRDGYMNSPETRKKVSEIWNKQGYRESRSGINSGRWKGNNVNVNRLHGRIKKVKLIPEVCDICHQKADDKGYIKLVLSNIRNHKYTDNPDDYQYVHESCHKKYDTNKRNQKIKRSEKNGNY